MKNICTFAQVKKWEYSSAGLEHLPYKQRVRGSNPCTPTYLQICLKKYIAVFLLFFIQLAVFANPASVYTKSNFNLLNYSNTNTPFLIKKNNPLFFLNYNKNDYINLTPVLGALSLTNVLARATGISGQVRITFDTAVGNSIGANNIGGITDIQIFDGNTKIYSTKDMGISISDAYNNGILLTGLVNGQSYAFKIFTKTLNYTPPSSVFINNYVTPFVSQNIITDNTSFQTTDAALGFSGSYISLPNTIFQTIASGDYTVETWFNTINSFRSYARILEVGGNTASNLISIGFSQNSGKLFFTAGNAGENISLSPVIANNTWYHVALVKKGTVAFLYLNGTLIHSITTGVGTPASTASAKIGASSFADSSFLGQLRDFRIWNIARDSFNIKEYLYKKLNNDDLGGQRGLFYWLPLTNNAINATTNITNATTLVPSFDKNSLGNSTISSVNNTGAKWKLTDKFITNLRAQATGVDGQVRIIFDTLANGSRSNLTNIQVYLNGVLRYSTIDSGISFNDAFQNGILLRGLTNGQNYTFNVHYFENYIYDINVNNTNAVSPFVGQNIVTDSTCFQTLTSGAGFNGAYIDLRSSIFQSIGGGDYTIETWFSTVNSLRNYVRLLEVGQAVSSNLISIGFNQTTGKLFFSAGAGGVNNSPTSPTIANNTWYHVALVKKGTAAYLYLNGNLIHFITTGAVTPASTASSKIGASSFGDLNYLGQLRDFRIWNVARDSFNIKEYSIKKLENNDTGRQRGLYYWLPLTNNGINASTNIANNTALVPNFDKSGAGSSSVFSINNSGAIWYLRENYLTNIRARATGFGGQVRIMFDTLPNKLIANLTNLQVYLNGALRYSVIDSGISVTDAYQNGILLTGLPHGQSYIFNVRYSTNSVSDFKGENSNAVSPIYGSVNTIVNTSYKANTLKTGIQGDYISLPALPILQNSNYTIETWFNTSNPISITATYIPIFTIGDSSTGVNYISVFFSWFSRKLYFTAGTSVLIEAGPTISPNTWYHIALVRRGGNQFFYLNGDLIKTVTGVTNITNVANVSTVRIGASNYSLNYSYVGQIRDFRIWTTARDTFNIQEYLTKTLEGTGVDGERGLYYWLSLIRPELKDSASIPNKTILFPDYDRGNLGNATINNGSNGSTWYYTKNVRILGSYTNKSNTSINIDTSSDKKQNYIPYSGNFIYQSGYIGNTGFYVDLDSFYTYQRKVYGRQLTNGNISSRLPFDGISDVNIIFTEPLNIKTSVINGSITPTTILKTGNKIRITYTPLPNYTLEKIWINGVNVGVDSVNGYTFNNLKEHINIQVVFAQPEIKTAVTNGVITPTKNYVYGTNVRITYSSLSNIAYIDSVFVNGVYIGRDSINGYTFYNIVNNLDIRVVYSDFIKTKVLEPRICRDPIITQIYGINLTTDTLSKIYIEYYDKDTQRVYIDSIIDRVIPINDTFNIIDTSDRNISPMFVKVRFIGQNNNYATYYNPTNIVCSDVLRVDTVSTFNTAVNNVITIKGIGFNPWTNIVRFGSVNGVIQVNTSNYTTLHVLVPNTYKSGFITVIDTINKLSAQSNSIISIISTNLGNFQSKFLNEFTDFSLTTASGLPYLKTFTSLNNGGIQAETGAGGYKIDYKNKINDLTANTEIADMDGDGLLDMVVGGETFVSATNRPSNLTIYKNLNSLSNADKFAKTDLVPISSNGSLFVDPDKSFIADFNTKPNFLVQKIKVVDIDNDGKLDIVVGVDSSFSTATTANNTNDGYHVFVTNPRSFYHAAVYYYKNNSTPGNIQFSSPIQLTNYTNFAIHKIAGLEVSDVNLDGKADIVLGLTKYYNGGAASNYFVNDSPSILAYKNISDKNNLAFNKSGAKIVTQTGLNNEISNVKIMDINKDNLPDIVFSNQSNGFLYGINNNVDKIIPIIYHFWIILCYYTEQ